MSFPAALPFVAPTAPALSGALQPYGADWTPEYGAARERWLRALTADRAALTERAAPFIAALAAARPTLHALVEGLDASTEVAFFAHVRGKGPVSYSSSPTEGETVARWKAASADAQWIMAQLPRSSPQYDRSGPRPVELEMDRAEVSARGDLHLMVEAVLRAHYLTSLPGWVTFGLPAAPEKRPMPTRFEPRWSAPDGRLRVSKEEVLALLLA